MSVIRGPTSAKKLRKQKRASTFTVLCTTAASRSFERWACNLVSLLYNMTRNSATLLVSSNLHPSLFAPLRSPTPVNRTTSLLSSAATTVHSTPAAIRPARARFNTPHLSMSACVVSSSATPTSTALSSSDVDSSCLIRSSSLLFSGTMKASVNGTMPGMRMAAATFSLKGRDEVSSAHCQSSVISRGWTSGLVRL